MQKGLIALAVMMVLAYGLMNKGVDLVPQSVQDKLVQEYKENPPKKEEYVVEKIFEHEGCRGYRFHKNFIRYHYYVVCGDKVTTSYDCGKNCKQEVSTIKE